LHHQGVLLRARCWEGGDRKRVRMREGYGVSP
jgi:hypothetical protein